MQPKLFAPTLLLPLALACAPRVSKRAPQPPPAPAPQAQRPSPAPPAAMAPVAALPPTTFVAHPAPAPEPVTEAPPAPTQRTYHAYSEAQVTALRASSTEFRRDDDELKSCTKRSEAAITRREEIPTEIAKIRMSSGGLNRDKERKIAKLNAEREELAASQQKQLQRCSDLEERLRRVLAAAYDQSTPDDGGLY